MMEWDLAMEANTALKPPTVSQRWLDAFTVDDRVRQEVIFRVALNLE